MKKSKNVVKSHVLRLLMMLAVMCSMLFTVHVSADDDDDVKPRRVYRVSRQTVTVTAGKELEFKVKMSPRNADDDYLRWKIVSGSKYVRFDDDDRDDDEIELKAVKAGTAKIRCYIKGNAKRKVDFTVKVTAAPKASKKIKAAGALKKTVEVDDDFELEVKKYSGLKDKYLKWSIENTRIVRFDDDDDDDDDDRDDG